MHFRPPALPLIHAVLLCCAGVLSAPAGEKMLLSGPGVAKEPGWQAPAVRPILPALNIDRFDRQRNQATELTPLPPAPPVDVISGGKQRSRPGQRPWDRAEDQPGEGQAMNAYELDPKRGSSRSAGESNGKARSSREADRSPAHESGQRTNRFEPWREAARGDGGPTNRFEQALNPQLQRQRPQAGPLPPGSPPVNGPSSRRDQLASDTVRQETYRMLSIPDRQEAGNRSSSSLSPTSQEGLPGNTSPATAREMLFGSSTRPAVALAPAPIAPGGTPLSGTTGAQGGPTGLSPGPARQSSLPAPLAAGANPIRGESGGGINGRVEARPAVLPVPKRKF